MFISGGKSEIILKIKKAELDLNVSGDVYDLAIGDIVNITHASLGFSAKPFRVLAVSFNEDYTMGLSLVNIKPHIILGLVNLNNHQFQQLRFQTLLLFNRQLVLH